MKLYITDTNEIDLRYTEYIDADRQRKVKKLRLLDDKKRCIAAGLLIKNFLGDKKITDNGYGKPVCEGICFNISHSGDYVILAADSLDIGCDIEKIRCADYLKLGRIVFSENEMEKLSNSADRTDAFFRLWTKKESLLKCMGKGFHRSAKSVDVSGESFFEDGITYFFKTFMFSDYALTVCSPKENFSVKPEFIGLKALISG